MFERFTSDSRQVLVAAQEAAARHGTGLLDTEHLLLGLLDHAGVNALLHLHGADPERLRTAMLEATEPVQEPAEGRPVFTERAKQVLELSLREAIDLDDRLIRPKHILLGVLSGEKGAAAEALARAGVTAEGVRSFTEMTENVTGVRRDFRSRIRDVWDFRASGAPLIATPGASRVPMLARELAGGGRVGTMHYLRALLTEKHGLSARVLQQLGVTEEKINAIAEELGVEGTSDEGPEERRARQVRIKLGSGREVTIEDEDVARQLHELASEGDDAVRDALRKLTED